VLEQTLRASLGPRGSLTTVVLDDPSLGHQDSLIGTRAATEQVRREIAAFLH
jgi:hypothetical protein